MEKLQREFLRAMLSEKCEERKRQRAEIQSKQLNGLLGMCRVANRLGTEKYCRVRGHCLRKKGCRGRIAREEMRCETISGREKKQCLKGIETLREECKMARAACRRIGFESWEGEGCSGVCQLVKAIMEIRKIRCLKVRSLTDIRRNIRKTLERIEYLKGLVGGTPSNRPRIR